MAWILSLKSGEQLVYKNLGKEVGVDEKTAKKWGKTLIGLYFGFEVCPWFRNVENSIRKTPKWFVRDWSMAEDVENRNMKMPRRNLLLVPLAVGDVAFALESERKTTYDGLF